MEPLLKARSIGLPLPGIYSVMADAWLAAAKPPCGEGDFNILGEGLRFSPGHHDSAAARAALPTHRENNAAAQSRPSGVCALPRQPADRARFEDLLASATPGWRDEITASQEGRSAGAHSNCGNAGAQSAAHPRAKAFAFPPPNAPTHAPRRFHGRARLRLNQPVGRINRRQRLNCPATTGTTPAQESTAP